MLGYFVTANDFRMLEDILHSFPNERDFAEAVEEMKNIFDSASPVVLTFPENKDNG